MILKFYKIVLLFDSLLITITLRCRTKEKERSRRKMVEFSIRHTESETNITTNEI